MKSRSFHWETLRSLFHKPVTIQRHFITGEKSTFIEGFRGRILYSKNNCVGCLLCIKLCPGGAITATPEKKIAIHVSRCITCGQCVEICPKKALSLSPQTPSIVKNKADLNDYEV